jgi:hypothetical protein
MNVRRGLFRIWIILSFLSTLMSLILIMIFAPINDEEFWIVAAMLVAPWMLTAAGLAARWAYAGFRAN